LVWFVLLKFIEAKLQLLVSNIICFIPTCIRLLLAALYSFKLNYLSDIAIISVELLKNISAD